MDLSSVKALTFDVGGTVFDWQSAVKARVAPLDQARNANIDVTQFALDWRLRFFQLLAKVRRGERDWCSADVLQLASLEEICQRYPSLELTDAERADLVDVWHAMDVWPDFPDAIERLRTRYRVIVLTVLSFSIVVDSSRHAGITWDGVLSGEFMRHYKPEKEAYLEGAERIRVPPESVMMVAAHTNDLRASIAAGFRTAYVLPKSTEPFPPDEENLDDFDFVAEDFTDLADKLVG